MHTKLLENGHVYFMYQPKLNHTHVYSLEDVARMHLLLIPEKITEQHMCRMLIIPKKMLPSTSTHRVHLGIVAEVSSNLDKIRKDLMESRQYLTPITQQERVTLPDRVVGEGVYRIDLKEDNHSYLSYVLETPDRLGHVQEAMHIEKEGCFAITIKNPKYVPQGKNPVEYPSHLLELFRNNKYSSIVTIELLNIENAQFLLIGATNHIEHEIHEYAAELEELALHEQVAMNSHSTMQQLHMDEHFHPMGPLEKGKFS
jgi:hypothetical protein